MQYHYYLYGMRVTADLDFVQLDPVRLPEDDRDFGREKVRIRAMDEEEEAQFRKEHETASAEVFWVQKKAGCVIVRWP